MKIIGTVETGGALGTIPHLQANYAKPRLRNNGYAAFNGQPNAEVPGLRPLLEFGDQPVASGHVQITYSDGQCAVLYAANFKDNTYSFC